MSEQEQDREKQAGMQTSAAGAQGEKGNPAAVPSEEVGQGPGLDPPSPAEDDDQAGDDEAFADRPTRQMEPPAAPAATDTEGAAVQRPPADS